MQFQEVRRSPRLSQRFGVSRTGDGASHTLATISYAATSRSSLGSYARTQRDNSILNESGQSVPPSFEEDGEEASFSTHKASPGKETAASQPGYVSAATAQLDCDGPSVPRGDMPKHLYGGFK